MAATPTLHMQNIYIVRGTEQAGPFTEAEIRAQLASGALTGESMVWWDGLPEWTPISRTPLAAAPSVPVAPAAPAVAPAPVVGIAPGAPQTSVLAIISLVIGILALPAIICWPISVALALAAIITGNIALVQHGKNPTPSGKGLAIAGLICGYLSIVIIIACTVVFLALGAQMKDLFVTIQSQLNAAAAAQATNNAPANQ